MCGGAQSGYPNMGSLSKPMSYGPGMQKTSYENAPLPGQTYPGFGGRYGPDQHQPNRGTPNTNPIPPGFQPPGTGVPWSMGGGLQTYGPDQHQPNRGTPNTTTQAPPWTGMGNVPWSMGQPQMSDPFSVNAPQPSPTPDQSKAWTPPRPPPPPMQPPPNQPPPTGQPPNLPPGAFIDEYGIARRAPETPFVPGMGQFGQYGQMPAGGFQGSVRNGGNYIGDTLFAAQGLNQAGSKTPVPDENMMNFVNYMNSYRK